MINIKKWFFGINADDSLRSLQNGECLNMENVRCGVSEFSKNNEVSNVQSTNLLYDIALPYTNLGLGRAVDFERQRLIWMDYNSNGLSQILAYDIPSQTTYIVLKESQTESRFNWDKAYRISRNAKVVNGLLIYTDNLNEPQCVDIEAGIKLNQPSYPTNVDAYGTPVLYTTTTLIKRPPIYRLTITKVTDSGFKNNYTALNAYQFAYYYTYKNNQDSALSTFSQLASLNYSNDTYNAVDVYMSFNEDIDDYVQSVTFVVRYGNFGKTFKIRTWNKNNYYDNLAIISQNSNAVALGFRFYDNVSGIAMDDVSASTAFDNVALLAKTVEVARNRVFLGNILKGYTTPSATSLTATIGTIDTGGAGTYTAHWKYFYINYTNDHIHYTPYTFYYAYESTLNPTSYYYSTHQSITPPASVNASDATTAWFTETDLYFYVYRNIPPPSGSWGTPTPTFYDTGSTLSLVVASTTNNVQFFKSSSSYNISIAFFDRYRRKCGVADKPVQINIDDRTYNQSVFSASINWALSNSKALDEIPDWAYYYQIHITLNLTTRFFEQIYCKNTAYVLKNQDGTYDYSPTTFVIGTTYAIGFDLTALFNYGLGYTFTEGDIVRMYKNDGTNVLLPVLGTDGNYVLCQPQDVGTLGTGQNFLIELYTPFKPSITEPYYETGDVFAINDPGTSIRTYSALSGSINGDTYAIERDKGGSSYYFVEAMSPNDKVWQVWQTDRGWINIVDTIGQTLVTTKGDYSDTFINGTKTNGLNKFQPLNTFDIGSDSGEIQKLQLTNKLGQQIGTVMLCVATNETLSIYLGESQLLDAAQNSNIALSSKVVGSINAMKNSRGTINPESVVEYNGMVWWADAINAKICQYADNGITDESDFKLASFFDHYFKKYTSLTSSQIEALCGFSYIESAVDPSTKELLFTLPQVEVNVVTSGIPVGYAPALPSYTTLPTYASSIQNRFVLYDGQPKTMIFKYEENRWMGAYQWLPDMLENVGKTLFGFKSGSLYLFNENADSYNTIFGVQYPQRICFVANIEPSAIGDLFNIAIEGNSVPNYSVAYSVYPWEQITDLIDTDYTTLEGIQDAKWFRDRLSPNATGTADEKLYKGDVVKSATLLIMLEFQEYDTQLSINFVNIGVEVSQGNNQVLSQK